MAKVPGMLVTRRTIFGEERHLTPQQAKKFDRELRRGQRLGADAIRAASLSQMTERVNAEHEKVLRQLRRSLVYAKIAGTILNKIKEKLVHGQFGPWLDDRFHGSRETARIYMRIAREWNEPRLLEARRSADPPRSINAILAVLRHSEAGPSEPKKPPFVKELTETQRRRLMLREMFKEQIEQLSRAEVNEMVEHFVVCWKKLRRYLRERTERPAREKEGEDGE